MMSHPFPDRCSCYQGTLALECLERGCIRERRQKPFTPEEAETMDAELTARRYLAIEGKGLMSSRRNGTLPTRLIRTLGRVRHSRLPREPDGGTMSQVSLVAVRDTLISLQAEMQEMDGDEYENDKDNILSRLQGVITAVDEIGTLIASADPGPTTEPDPASKPES